MNHDDEFETRVARLAPNTDPGAAKRYLTLAANARTAAARTRDRALRATYESLAARYEQVSRELTAAEKPVKAKA